jgi:hypothetical protein
MRVCCATAAGNAVGRHPHRPHGRADGPWNGTECALIGAWAPFHDSPASGAVPTHDDYVAKVTAAVNASVVAGFVLPADAAKP